MKTHSGVVRKAKGQKKTVATHLDELLAHKTDNPVVNMVRWFFFYADESTQGRVHGKTLAH